MAYQNKLTEHERIYEILSDYEWHSAKEFIFTHHLTKPSSRIGEMIRKEMCQVERQWVSIDGTKWKEYRMIRPEPVQERLSKVYF